MTDYNIIFHYPPELTQILIKTIPLLCASKKDVLLFFQGAGVSPEFYLDISKQLLIDKTGINKFEMVRRIITKLNERGEKTLRERREIIKRIVEFENFSACWPNDQLSAKGLVYEIRQLVNAKDTFTRINNEREEERKKASNRQEGIFKQQEVQKEKLKVIKNRLYALFSEANPQKRGKSLESVLNELFKHYGILIKEAFTLNGTAAEGIIEQIDGAVELDGILYLVEMKWVQQPLGVPEITQHISRVLARGAQVRGIVISHSGFSAPTISTCRDAIPQGAIIVLCKLEEIIKLLESDLSLLPWLKEKIQYALLKKEPLHQCE